MHKYPISEHFIDFPTFFLRVGLNPPRSVSRVSINLNLHRGTSCSRSLTVFFSLGDWAGSGLNIFPVPCLVQGASQEPGLPGASLDHCVATAWSLFAYSGACLPRVPQVLPFPFCHPSAILPPSFALVGSGAWSVEGLQACRKENTWF